VLKWIVALIALGAGIALLLMPVGDGPGQTVTVVRGDTLGRIAQKAGVTLDDLRAWNDIDGDLIKVGQELAVGPPSAGEPAWRVLLARFTPPGVAPEVDEPIASAPAPPARRRRAVRASDGGAPLPDEPATSWPPLRPPSPKECMDAFAGLEDGGDRAFGRSEGLSGAQVKSGVAAFQQQTLRCADGHESIAGQVLLELSIGCDGRVLSASVLDDGTPAEGFAACVAQVMQFASFPAHARDSVTVQVPLAYVD
jgi:LysM repeat protein